MHKNDFLELRQNDIGFAGQILSMQSEPVAKPVEDTSNSLFDARIAPLDAGHDKAPFFWGENVGHQIIVTSKPASITMA